MPQREYTYKELMAEIEGGKLLLVFDLKVYDVTTWVKSHPGGLLPIKHQMGRDATDHVLAFHSPEVVEKLMPNFCVGTLRITPESSKIFNTPLSMAYRDLTKEITKEGYYKTNSIWFVLYLLLVLAFLVSSVAIIFVLPALPTWLVIPATILSGILMGFVNQQNTLLVHDVSHMQVTQSRAFDTLFAATVGPIITGISANWWKERHSIHHIVHSDPRHDPIVQQLPIFCSSTRMFKNIYSTYFDRVIPFNKTALFFAKAQHITFYIMYMTFTRYFVYIGSLRLGRNRVDAVHRKHLLYLPFEYLGLFIHFAWSGYLMWSMPNWTVRILWNLVVNACYFMVIVQMNISHLMLPIEEIPPEESFVERSYRATLDIEVPVWMDWFHCGVQHHAAHHLFPRVPRYRLRELTEKKIIPFAKRNDVPYIRATFVKGYGLVHKHLKKFPSRPNCSPKRLPTPMYSESASSKLAACSD